MAQYCVNTNDQTNGDHEVHNLATCEYLPEPKHRKALGEFSSCEGAVREAKKTYSTANGCYYCSNKCHTT
jgi:hypothetical protein